MLHSSWAEKCCNAFAAAAELSLRLITVLAPVIESSITRKAEVTLPHGKLSKKRKQAQKGNFYCQLNELCSECSISEDDSGFGFSGLLICRLLTCLANYGCSSILPFVPSLLVEIPVNWLLT